MCVAPAAGYLLTRMSCHKSPTQGRAHALFTHGRIQYEHVIESERDRHKRDVLNDKCDIRESEFVVQAITHT